MIDFIVGLIVLFLSSVGTKIHTWPTFRICTETHVCNVPVGRLHVSVDHSSINHWLVVCAK